MASGTGFQQVYEQLQADEDAARTAQKLRRLSRLILGAIVGNGVGALVCAITWQRLPVWEVGILCGCTIALPFGVVGLQRLHRLADDRLGRYRITIRSLAECIETMTKLGAPVPGAPTWAPRRGPAPEGTLGFSPSRIRDGLPGSRGPGL